MLDHLQTVSEQSYVAPYNIAVIYAGMGDKDRAFRWLNRAFEGRSYLLAVYLPTDARLDSLQTRALTNSDGASGCLQRMTSGGKA